MSTLNVESISHPTPGSNVTVNGITPASTNSLGLRNLVINGAMQVAQRGTQVTGVTVGGYRTVDRFNLGFNVLGTWTIDQSTDSPNEFSNSLKVTNTTADASPDAGDYALVTYEIEAQNLQGLGYGSSDAKTLTLSFWVKSNKTGSASFDLRQRDNSNKLFSATYSISSANTWEYKTIAIPADTAGNINNDSGSGLSLGWWLNSGSNFTGGSAASTWSTADNTRRNPSNLGVGGATSDYFAITGVQLEVGSVATPFEHRSYGDELAKCQRYCYAAVADGGLNPYMVLGTGRWYDAGNAQIAIQHPVQLRTAPTLESTSPANTFHINLDASLGGASPTALSLNEPGFNVSTITVSYAPLGRPAGTPTTLYCNTGVAKIVFSAEL